MWLCPVCMSHCITSSDARPLYILQSAVGVGAVAMCAYQQHAKENGSLDACCVTCVQHAQRHVYVTPHPSRDCKKMHTTEKHRMNCNCLPAIVCAECVFVVIVLLRRAHQCLICYHIYSLTMNLCSKRVMMSVYKCTQMQHCGGVDGWELPASRRTGKPECIKYVTQ